MQAIEISHPESLLSTIESSELQELDHSFWLKLGIEHCNMRKWSQNIAFMLQTNFGKSDPLVKLFFQFHTLYSNLSCVLDDIICYHYPLDITNISVPLSLQPIYNDNTNDNTMDTIASRSIIGIFYRSDTIHDYSLTKYVTTGNKRYAGYISSRDMQYITHFIARNEEYLEYVKRISDDISKNNFAFRNNLIKKITDLQSKYQRLQQLLLNVRVEEHCIGVTY